MFTNSFVNNKYCFTHSLRLKNDPDIGRLVMSVFSWDHYAASKAVYGLREVSCFSTVGEICIDMSQ